MSLKKFPGITVMQKFRGLQGWRLGNCFPDQWNAAPEGVARLNLRRTERTICETDFYPVRVLGRVVLSLSLSLRVANCSQYPENPYPLNFGGWRFTPPNLRGESSKNTCFTVFSGEHSLNLGGEIFTPQIWGVWVLKVPPVLFDYVNSSEKKKLLYCNCNAILIPMNSKYCNVTVM